MKNGKPKQSNADAPAFGHVAMTESNGFQEPGLTKREYFAAMAMQGILSSCFASMNPMPEHLAKDALNYADALLSELEKPIQ